MQIIVVKTQQFDTGMTDVWVCKGYQDLIETTDSYFDFLEYDSIWDEEDQKLYKEGWKVTEWDIVDEDYKVPTDWKIDESYWLDKTPEEFIEAFSGTYHSDERFELIEVVEVK